MLFGCMHIGGSWDESPILSSTQENVNGLLQSAIELGITAFDHADIYCRGKSETIFGNYFVSSGLKREHLFIQSKCGIQLGAGALGSNHYNFNYDYILESTNKSLERLKCDYLDALILHRPDVLWNVKEVAKAFQHLKDSGVVKSFGVSNMGIGQIELLRKYYPDIKYSQIQFGIGHTHILNDDAFFNTDKVSQGGAGVLAYHELHDIELQAWSPLDNGKFLREDSPNPALSKLIAQMAKKYGVSKQAILLAWITKPSASIIPVLGSQNLERIKEALQFTNIEIEHQDWYDLWITSLQKKLP